MLHTVILFLLGLLFAFRVSAQLLQSLFPVPYLPPFSAWQSGVLPYPCLLFFQALILAGLFRVAVRHARGMVVANRELGKRVSILGAVYAGVMVTRYALHMLRFPEHRWMGGTIPIFFHLVLACFLLAVGHFHLHRVPFVAGASSSRARRLWMVAYALLALGIAAWMAYQLSLT